MHSAIQAERKPRFLLLNKKPNEFREIFPRTQGQVRLFPPRKLIKVIPVYFLRAARDGSAI
jgi:hypothetical protein